jgi:protein-S-isoprenylcysteine O-methyltransferase Ste14
MWHKFLSTLWATWPRLWPPLLAAGLVAGFNYCFNYLLRRRDEKRELRKKLSAEVYIPMRQQLSEAESAIREFKRAFSINTEMWKSACTTGICEKLNPSIRSQLAVLYENTFPGHDKAWQDLNNELGRVGIEWDRRYADIQDYAVATKDHNIVQIVWWTFLTGDAPATPVDGLRQGDVLRIWNGFMTPGRFKVLDLSVEQFLIQRWEEMGRNDFLRQYRDYRQRALAQIPKAVACLSREALY